MAISKTSKINAYKLISPNIQKAAAAGAADKAAASYSMKTIEAFNNLGSTLNSIGLVVVDIKKIELKRLEDEKKRIKKFTPKYNKVEKPQFASFINDYVGRGAPKFFEGLLKILGGLIKLAIIRPALEWLSDPENKKKIANAIETLAKVFKWITNFFKSRVVGILDGLYDLLKEDATWWERLTGFAKSFINLGALFVGIRWLTNPKALINDVRTVLKLFYRSLTKFHRGLKTRGRFPGGWKGKALGTVITVGGAAYMANKARNINQGFDEGADQEEMAYGGYRPKPLPGFATGGWISGPDSGYPVSTSPGGGSPEFIGHGTEYVAKKNTGESFIIPFNNFATKANPGLTMANMQMAAADGFDLPRLSDKQFFFGSIGKAIGGMFGGGNKGGGFGGGSASKPKSGGGFWSSIGSGLSGLFGGKGGGQGTSGIGPVANAASYGAMLQGGSLGLDYKDGRATFGSFMKSPLLGQIGGALFGNKGSAIGGALSTIMGGGSGEGGKATFKDILGIAGSFIKPGSKASKWLGIAGGIGNTMFGEGTEGMSFGQRLGHLAKNVIGNMSQQGGIGGLMGNILGGVTGDGGMNQALGNVLGARGGGGGGGSAGPNQKLVGGGQQAVNTAGRQFLNQGYTVFNHPNFKRNKWRKGPPNRGGYDPSGKQRNPKDGLHKKGLALDVQWFGKGDKKSMLKQLADRSFSNRKGLKLTEISYGDWGSWTFGGNRRTSGGERGKLHFGFGDRQVAGSGAIGMSESDLNRMKQAIIQQAGGDGVDGMAMAAKTIMNQAGLVDSGSSSSVLGGAKSLSDILDNLGAGNKMYSQGQMNKADAALQGAMDNDWLAGMITGKGFSEPQAYALMNSTTYKKGGAYSPSFNASSVKFGGNTFSTLGNHDFNDWMAKSTLGGPGTGLGGSGVSTKETDTKKKSGNEAQQQVFNTSYGGGATQASSASGSTGNILNTGKKGGPSGTGGNEDSQKKESYALKKAYQNRAYARENITDRTRRLVQETMAAVEAHNSSVRANVAAAQSAIEQLKKGGGGNLGGLMGSKSSLNASRLQSTIGLKLG